MNHKAPLLWILLQFAAALFSSAHGENAVLKGKKLILINKLIPGDKLIKRQLVK